ncbi:MAG: nucleotide pyrophosphohydrolase [Candidatus Thermoplasmatota archaeon]
MEKELGIADFQRLVDGYVSERNWRRYHKPKDLAISIAIESAELLELFQWKPDPPECGELGEEIRARIGEELADVVIYSACMANALDIDLSEALLDKIHKNKSKYPVAKVARAKDWDEVRSARAKPSDMNGDD